MNILTTKELEDPAMDLSNMSGGYQVDEKQPTDSGEISSVNISDLKISNDKKNGESASGSNHQNKNTNNHGGSYKFHIKPWQKNLGHKGSKYYLLYGKNNQVRKEYEKVMKLNYNIMKEAMSTPLKRKEDVYLLNELFTALINHDTRRPIKPDTAFKKYMKEIRSGNANLPMEEVEKGWYKLTDLEKRQEQSWIEFKKYSTELEVHNKKKIELINKIKEVIGRPKIREKVRLIKGLDVFWKENVERFKSEMPDATEYEIYMRKIEEWKKLTREEKSYYIELSTIENENTRHILRVELLSRIANESEKLIKPKIGNNL